MESDDQHTVFKNDPIYFKSLLGKKVKVTLLNKTEYTGEVYCIDPVSESVILVNKHCDKYDTDILFGYTVRNIEVLSEEVSQDVIFQDTDTVQTEGLTEKKNKIKEWLNKNLITVKDDGVILSIGDDLTILPPYTLERCIGSNTIILQRIHDILSRMPVEC